MDKLKLIFFVATFLTFKALAGPCIPMARNFWHSDIPAPHKKLFSKKINHPKLYLWDNWGFEENGVTHVYSLAASKKYDARERHFHVHWRHFISRDKGDTWQDLGAVLWPQKNANTFDGKSIWSGSVTKLPSGKYIAAYTGLHKKGDFLQSISFALSDDAHNFTRLYDGKTPALSHELHREKFIKAGYYVDEVASLGTKNGEVNNSIQALRDPFLLQEADGLLHMFWAAKSYNEKNEVVSSIGHAIIKDLKSPDSIDILPPIRPTDGNQFTQLELPNVFHHKDGKYIWIIGTTNRVSEKQAEHEVGMAIRGYISDSLQGELKPLKESSLLIESSKAKVYGANLLQNFDQSKPQEKIPVRVFSVGEDENSSYQLPASMELFL